MQREEVEALGRVGGLLAEEITGWAEQHHRAVAGRALRWVGPAGAPVRVVHDAVADGAYRGVRALGRFAGRGLGGLLAPLATGVPVSTSLVGGQAVAVLDAVLGDRLDDEGSALSLPMVLRVGRADLGTDRAALAAAYPGATARVVVFVHGLGHTDLSWLGRDIAGEPWSYAHALEPAGWTGALLRYNSGRPIAANGASLASLLEALTTAWPRPVVDLALVGHSMGGLVIRSACAQGTDAGHAWPALVRSCVYLGSPHHGAPLEQGADMVAGLLGRLPETGAVATALRLRSAGIKNLRHGILAGDRGGDAAVDDLLDGPALLATARHHLVAGHLGLTGRHPAAVMLGDLVVREASALGHRRAAALGPCERATFPATSHHALLHDRRVGDALAGWLS